MREPLLGCAVGKKGIGKTTETLKMINRYVAGNPAKGVKARRVLILDVNDEFSNIKALALKDVRRFSIHPIIEARRIRIWKESGKKMTLDEIAEALYYILENFRGGMILVEDISKYVSDSLPGDLIGSLCTQRHTDTDVILHFQTIGKAGHPKIIGNLNWLRFHKISDSVERHKTKFTDKEELFKIAEILVNAQFYAGNERFFVYVDCDRYKIRGAYSQQMFKDAIQEYLGLEHNSIIKPILNRRDGDGKLLYDYKRAFKEMSEKLFKQYYGNA